MPHIVQYRESERGWGGEVWFRGFDTKEDAEKEVLDTNKDLPDEVPDYYIKATYMGVMVDIPKSYKI